LDKPVQQRITKFFDKLLESEHPKTQGKTLSNKLSPFWTYRVGDYRIMCRFEDEELVIVAVKVGHRRDVYDFEP